MPSARAVAGGSTTGDNLLKGSDLKPGEDKISLIITGVRVAPSGFKSRFILEVVETHGKTDWAVNQTNVGALITLIDDDYEKWQGWTIKLEKFLTTNPSTRKQAWGLAVIGAEKTGVPEKKKRGFKTVTVRD